MDINACIRKTQRSEISDLEVHLKPKVNQSRTNNIINMRAEIHVINNKENW